MKNLILTALFLVSCSASSLPVSSDNDPVDNDPSDKDIPYIPPSVMFDNILVNKGDVFPSSKTLTPYLSLNGTLQGDAFLVLPDRAASYDILTDGLTFQHFTLWVKVGIISIQIANENNNQNAVQVLVPGQGLSPESLPLCCLP